MGVTNRNALNAIAANSLNQSLAIGQANTNAMTDLNVSQNNARTAWGLISNAGSALASGSVAGLIGGAVGAVGGFLMGNIAAGLLLGLFMSNAGGLWDNAKKRVEAGHHGGRGTAAHRAAVIGHGGAQGGQGILDRQGGGGIAHGGVMALKTRPRQRKCLRRPRGGPI